MTRLFAVLLSIAILSAAAQVTTAEEASQNSWLSETRKLLDAARQGDAAARTKLDAMFARDIPAPYKFLGPHAELGRDFYRYGALLGIPKAMHFLGNMYCSDIGELKKDENECNRWHREAAKHGYAPSMAALSAGYRYGAVRDLDQSRYWERQAAESGDGQSMLYLAKRYKTGDEVPANQELAEYWYKRAEAAGVETPAVLKRKNAETVAKLRAAAKAGDAEAMYALGKAYNDGGYYGWGLRQDYAEALRWYHEAADRGHEVAANSLGVLYGRGLGVAVDYHKAMRWYRIAAEKGVVRAMYNIAGMFKRGEGTETDYAAALAWYRVANDHIPMDPMKWPFEVRVLFDLFAETCRLPRRMNPTERAKADDVYAELSKKMKSPLAASERLASTREFQEMCVK